MKLGGQPEKWLRKKAKLGMRGYPIGTIAFYGPDARRASKVAGGVVPAPKAGPSELRRWLSTRAMRPPIGPCSRKSLLSFVRAECIP